MRLPGRPAPEVQKAFAELEPYFLAIRSAAEELLSPDDYGRELSETQHAAIARVMAHENQFLQHMQALVGLYETAARSHVWQLQLLGWGIVAAILAVLVAIQWLVVGPAVETVGLRFAASEAQYRRLVESMSEGLMVHDDQGGIQFANSRFCELVDLPVQELLGKQAVEFVAPADRDRYSKFLASTVPYADTIELGIIGVEGRRTETMASAQSLFDVGGTAQGSLWVLTDITARKQAEHRSRELLDQLAHADRLKSMGELAAGLAHEVNQPLAAIANYAGSCLTLIETTDSQLRDLLVPLQRIESAAVRGGEIIHRARKFAQRRPHEVHAESLNALVFEVEQLCLPEARRRDVTIELMLASDLPLVPVDGIQIQQVLTNLIQNALIALDGNKSPRRVEVSTELVTPELARVSVRDNGPGLVGVDTNRVFEPFFSTHSEGLGLGLAIARNIVEAHGGVIETFNHPDRGAIFQFTLPTQPPVDGAVLIEELAEGVHA